MKLAKIQNAYIKNKPNYYYEIKDEDGLFVAKGHLLSTKLKLTILKHITYTMDENGKFEPKILSYVDFSTEWIIRSLDLWVLGLDITKEYISNLLLSVLLWLVQLIQKKNELSIDMVDENSKN